MGQIDDDETVSLLQEILWSLQNIESHISEVSMTNSNIESSMNLMNSQLDVLESGLQLSHSYQEGMQMALFDLAGYGGS